MKLAQQKRLILLLPVLLFACAEGEEVSNEEEVLASIAGVWVSSCQSVSRGVSTQVELSFDISGSFTRKDTLYDDGACDEDSAYCVVESKGSFEIEGAADVENSESAMILNWEIVESTNKVGSMSDCQAVQIELRKEYTVFEASAQGLHFGGPFGDFDGTTRLKRHKVLDKSSTFEREKAVEDENSEEERSN